MEKMILIDGNSLLNRAYYAMSVFSTKDGLPTNGIFGFVKLVFKIIEDEKPDYFVVAFDLHAPTFRHKMYSDYKATRKPMPEELAKQVPVLKSLLREMQICVVEKEGYEADDVIGTLSRKFDSVHSYIYTGDRDSYQLVNAKVTVCYTKRGVSDIDRLTANNFYEKVGLVPEQIIEEKALMGDSSDNIPGVRGIGPKGAMDLLKEYGNLDKIYENLEKLHPRVKNKLSESREIAYLSRELATIDTGVPLDISLKDCALSLPFPEEARTMFGKLEFRSLVNSAFFPAERRQTVEKIECRTLDMFPAPEKIEEFALSFEPEGCHIFCENKEYLFPLRTDLFGAGFFLSDLKPLLTELFSGNKTVYVSDVKALAHKLDEIDVTISCRTEDVTLLRYLGDSNLRPMGAKELAKDYSLPEENCAYALKIAFAEAAEKLKDTAEERLYRELELPLSFILLDMEREGVRMDVGRFSYFAEKYNRELEELSAKIYALAGVDPFNLNSPVQLSEVLFDKLAFDAKGVKRNARGAFSTSADVLEKLAEEHEIARLILRHREIQKLKSTYIEGIRPLVTGEVIHTTYNQTTTTTGRLSSANPNLQNIPIRKEDGRELRKLFIAREGNLFVDADYSQIELRLLAHFSGCAPLIQAYNEGRDIHAATAAHVFGVSPEEVTPLMRRRAKTINFGIIYGMSSFGLAKDLSCSSADAQKYIDTYFQRYPEIKEYMEENVNKAKEDGYVTTILGRKRHIPEIRSQNYNIRSFGERAAMNMPLQGSSADIIKVAMLRVDKRLKKEGLRSKMVLQVHDELVLDVPEAELEIVSALLKEEMERAIELRVPLIAEVSTGKSWYDAK